jgi:hypothetical protein
MSYIWDESTILFQKEYAIGSIKLTTDQLNLPPPPDSPSNQPKCWENSGNLINGISQCKSSTSNLVDNTVIFDTKGPHCAPDYILGSYPVFVPPPGIPYDAPAAAWPCANYSVKFEKNSMSPLGGTSLLVCKNGLVQDPLGCPDGYDNIFRHVKSTSVKDKHGFYSLGSIFSTVCAKEQSVGETCKIGKNGTARCLSNDCQQECIDSNKICKSNRDQSACLLDPLKSYPNNNDPNSCGVEYNCSGSDDANWSLYIDPNNIQDYKKGWIICEFYFDFFEKSTYTNPSNFKKWASDIFKGDGLKILPTTFSVPLIIRAYLFYTGYILYSYMFNSIINNDFNFNKSVDFLLNGFQKYIDNMLNPLSGSIKQLNNLSILMNIEQLNTQIHNAFMIPLYDFASNSFKITINQYQYDTLSKMNEKDQDNILTGFMDYFLMNSQTTPAQQFVLHIDPEKTIINVINTNPSTLYTISQYPLNTSSLHKDEFIVSYTLYCKVEKWSHMLMIYYEYLVMKQHIIPPIDISGLCEKMYKDTGLYSNSCVKSKCNNDKNCFLNLSLTECEKIVTPGYPSQQYRSGDYLFTSSNENCDCLTSNLAPPVASQYDNMTAMCFSSSCDQHSKDIYGLDDKLCKTQCSQMYDWIHSTNPLNRIQHWGNLDDAYYKRLCNDVFNVSPSGFYWKIFIYMCILTILSSHSTFHFLNHRKVNKTYVIFGVSFIFLSMLALSIFLGFDLYGISYCRSLGKDEYMECKSSISKINIPLYFCKTYIPCQCVKDSDCGTNCNCLSQVCFPKDDKDKDKYVYETIQIKQLNPFILIVLGVISLFIMRYIWHYVSKDRLVLFSVIVFLVVMIYLLSIENYTKFKNTTSC